MITSIRDVRNCQLG